MSRHWRYALLWALVILVLCLIPGKSLPEWHWFALFDLDKLVHAGMFFVLALLLAQALRVQGTTRYLVWACVISALYGIGTEFMQGVEALGRRTDPGDMIANTIGAILAAWFMNWCLKKGREYMPFAFLR